MDAWGVHGNWDSNLRLLKVIIFYIYGFIHKTKIKTPCSYLPPVFQVWAWPFISLKLSQDYATVFFCCNCEMPIRYDTCWYCILGTLNLFDHSLYIDKVYSYYDKPADVSANLFSQFILLIHFGLFRLHVATGYSWTKIAAILKQNGLMHVLSLNQSAALTAGTLFQCPSAFVSSGFSFKPKHQNCMLPLMRWQSTRLIVMKYNYSELFQQYVGSLYFNFPAQIPLLAWWIAFLRGIMG